MNDSARIAIYFEVDRMRGPRACAATVLARYASEWRRDRRFNPGLEQAKQIAARWRLGDYYNCLLACQS